MMEQELKQYKEKLQSKVHELPILLYRDHSPGWVLVSEYKSVQLGVCINAMFYEFAKHTDPKILNEYLKCIIDVMQEKDLINDHCFKIFSILRTESHGQQMKQALQPYVELPTANQPQEAQSLSMLLVEFLNNDDLLNATLLLKLGVQPLSPLDNSPMHKAIHINDNKMLSTLVNNYPELLHLKLQGKTPVDFAISKNDLYSYCTLITGKTCSSIDELIFNAGDKADVILDLIFSNSQNSCILNDYIIPLSFKATEANNDLQIANIAEQCVEISGAVMED